MEYILIKKWIALNFADTALQLPSSELGEMRNMEYGCNKFTTSGAHDVIVITTDLCTEELWDSA